MPHIRTLTGEKIEDWSFKRADTRYLTHGLHIYPARMIPQISRRLIERYSRQDCTVLDPFCGSGSVLLEARLRRRLSVGVDINPLATNVAKARTTILDMAELEDAIQELRADIRRNSGLGDDDLPIPGFQNLHHWFKRNVVHDLAVIRKSLDSVTDKSIRTFTEICFSSALRKVSNIAHFDNPYFIRAMKGEKLRKHNPDTYRSFSSVLASGVKAMRELVTYCKSQKINNYQPKILLGDSRVILDDVGQIDIVVTSPPYGEEKNTMSYFRFAKLSCYWLWTTPEKLREHEKLSLGYGKSQVDASSLESPTLQDLAQELGEKNSRRRDEVLAFFSDYRDVLGKLYECLGEGGYCCIVIGNRSADRMPVQNDQITRELAENLGFCHQKTHHREIPSKVLPKHDGRVSLINRESILILKK